MKKFVGLAMMLIYMFTASSLVHASTMGFFGHTMTTTHISHCHNTTSDSNNKASKQNMNCCELFTTSQYSQVKLDLKNFIKIIWNTTVIHPQDKYTYFQDIPVFKHISSSSPWRQNTRSKYMTFSDLFGIIKNLS